MIPKEILMEMWNQNDEEQTETIMMKAPESLRPSAAETQKTAGFSLVFLKRIYCVSCFLSSLIF